MYASVFGMAQGLGQQVVCFLLVQVYGFWSVYAFEVLLRSLKGSQVLALGFWFTGC